MPGASPPSSARTGWRSRAPATRSIGARAGAREPADPRFRPQPGAAAMIERIVPAPTDVVFDRDSGRARLPDDTGTAVASDGVRTRLRRLRAAAIPRSCSCRRRRSSIRASGRARSPTSAGTTGWSRSTAAAMAARTARPTRRPTRDDRIVGDIEAVMDATGTDQGGHRRPVRRRRLAGPSELAAADSRSRVTGSSRSRSACPRLSPAAPLREASSDSFDDELPDRRRLGEGEPPLLAARLPGLRAVLLLRRSRSEPHSTKVDRGRRPAGRSTASVDAMLGRGRGPVRSRPGRRVEAICRAVRCPMLIVHGTDDHCQPVARAPRGSRS